MSNKLLSTVADDRLEKSWRFTRLGVPSQPGCFLYFLAAAKAQAPKGSESHFFPLWCLQDAICAPVTGLHLHLGASQYNHSTPVWAKEEPQFIHAQGQFDIWKRKRQLNEPEPHRWRTRKSRSRDNQQDNSQSVIESISRILPYTELNAWKIFVVESLVFKSWFQRLIM